MLIFLRLRDSYCCAIVDVACNRIHTFSRSVSPAAGRLTAAESEQFGRWFIVGIGSIASIPRKKLQLIFSPIWLFRIITISYYMLIVEGRAAGLNKK
jgi:hypothetical protein